MRMVRGSFEEEEVGDENEGEDENEDEDAEDDTRPATTLIVLMIKSSLRRRTLMR